DDLLGGGPIEGQIALSDALAELKTLLEDKAVLKIGQNLKYDIAVMARHNIAIAPFDDTMLLSYVLDASPNGGHGMDALAQKWLGDTAIAYKDVAGTGRKAISFDQVELDKATAYAGEDA